MTSFISYSQNFEDVMLWRALKHVENGFYIDIGAQDPLIDSVSMAFHEHGWSGIHVEPTPQYADLLRQQRPGDTIIQAAVGTGPAVIRFFEILDKGISTADPVIAQQHRDRGFDVHEITVPCIALSSIFASCVEPEIHWLKIDVEGLEQQVLSSWGASAQRPWIVVVESTLPLTQIDIHQTWESILISYGYSPAYFDGLNRYYISDVHPELRDAFLTPPHIFDNFTLNGTSSAPFHQLIQARYKRRIDEVLKQNEQRQLVADKETERLILALGALDNTQHEHEQKWAQREQEFAAQLLAIQQQAEQEKTEQAYSNNEQERTLRHQHAEREHALNQQLQATQEQLRDLEQNRAKREQTLSEQTDQIRKELDRLLRTQVQREQEFAAQLLAIQQRAEQEKIEQAHSYNDQASALRRQHAEREHTLNQQLQAGQEELRLLEQDRTKREQVLSERISQIQQSLESILRTSAKREQEFAVKLLAIQQQAEQEKIKQARSHYEQERILYHQSAEREHTLHQQLQAGQEELRRLEQDRAKREQVLSDQTSQARQALESVRHTLEQREQEIAALQSEKQALGRAQRLLKTELDEHNRLIAACTASEVQLKAKILSEQQTSLQLRQALAELHASIESLMFPSAQAVQPPPSPPASSLDELLASHDQQFVCCAYQTLLGREPDHEGLVYYLDRLRQGFAKIGILAQIRRSKEGRRYAANLPGLDKAIRCFRRGQYPLIGWLFRRFNGGDSNNATERKLRRIENQIFLLGGESDRGGNQLQTTLSSLHHLVVLQTQSIIMSQGCPPSETPNIPSAPPNHPADADGLHQVSPHARDFYLQLKKTAANIHAERTA